MQDGDGKFTWADGASYKGEFFEDMKDGDGECRFLQLTRNLPKATRDLMLHFDT